MTRATTDDGREEVHLSRRDRWSLAVALSITTFSAVATIVAVGYRISTDVQGVRVSVESRITRSETRLDVAERDISALALRADRTDDQLRGDRP